jgi:F420-0:gamma-glutamyl ligase
MQFRALPGIGLIESGADLAAIITKAAEEDGFHLVDDVVVIAQKIVSKAEGRVVNLADVTATRTGRRGCRPSCGIRVDGMAVSASLG